MKKILLVFALAVALFAKRIVVLDPASVETLFALGAGEQIVGIATLQHSQIEPAAQTARIPSVGSFSHPSVEKILRLKPDLVVLSSYSLGVAKSLDNFKIKHIYLKSERFADLEENVKILASHSGISSQKTAEVIADFNARLNALRAAPLNKTALFLFSQNPLMAFGKATLMDDVLQILGVKNLAPDTAATRPIISHEFVRKANPQLILLGVSADNKERFLEQNPLLKQTTAAKNGEIYFYPKTHSLLRLSPFSVKRIEEFRKTLANF